LATLRTPANVRRIDIVVSISFTYSTAATNRGVLDVIYSAAGHGPSTMQPTRRVVAGSPSRSSTTLTWIAKHVRAAGRAYTFELGAQTRDNRPGRIETRNLAVVIDAWSAGPR
jgi:hypothetical protein